MKLYIDKLKHNNTIFLPYLFPLKFVCAKISTHTVADDIYQESFPPFPESVCGDEEREDGGERRTDGQGARRSPEEAVQRADKRTKQDKGPAKTTGREGQYLLWGMIGGRFGGGGG